MLKVGFLVHQVSLSTAWGTKPSVAPALSTLSCVCCRPCKFNLEEKLLLDCKGLYVRWMSFLYAMHSVFGIQIQIHADVYLSSRILSVCQAFNKLPWLSAKCQESEMCELLSVYVWQDLGSGNSSPKPYRLAFASLFSSLTGIQKRKEPTSAHEKDLQALFDSIDTSKKGFIDARALQV